MSTSGVRVAVVGATGMVGQEFLQLLGQRAFPMTSLRLMASERSAGRRLACAGAQFEVEALTRASFEGVDVAFFSAGGDTSRAHAPRAAKAGALVIDNSSAFRGDPDVPLVVPEVNGDEALGHHGIVANPNCTTILLVMVLRPIDRQARIRRVVCASYQAVSGSGARGVQEWRNQVHAWTRGEPPVVAVYPRPIHDNVIPFVQAFDDGGLTTEEWKLVRETRRILGREDLAVTATCVRVPVERAHSEAVNLEFDEPVDPAAVRGWLRGAPGVRVVDDPAAMAFPTPQDAEGGDDVLVGRIRKDPCHPRALDLWLTGDQVRKGAALNAVQIAEHVLGITPAQAARVP